MLQFELTPKHAGVIVWGDTWTLHEMYDLVHQINESSPIIENKEGFFLGLAYDLRKAYDGQRRKSTLKFFDDECPIYGVEILWPVLIAQVGILRASMSFVPTTRGDQAVAYGIEYLIECAVRKALPGQEDGIIRLMHTIGIHPSHIEDVINSRCRYFIDLPPKERLKMLPDVLQSFDVMFDFVSKQKYYRGRIPSNAFDAYANEDIDWPDFKW
jgi:hypothetical protein